MSGASFLFSLLSGCTSKWELIDLDEDGYTFLDGDCDENNPLANPAGTEVWYNGVDENCDGNDADQDLDGYIQDGYESLHSNWRDFSRHLFLGDCDDLIQTINPGATEILSNGVDDDCTPSTPDSTRTIYVDSDGDGYGVDDSSTNQELDTTQPVPEGYSDQAGDCDDDNEEVNPAALEVCNEIDDNCDGQVDNTDGDVIWYADTDGDGDGDPNSTTTTPSCAEAPQGYSANDNDCNDSNSDVNLSALEVCDTVDNDCDGRIDDDDEDITGQGGWYPDSDEDGQGSSSASAYLSCDEPEGYSADNLDCDDTDGNVYLGAVETCDGIDNDCDSRVDTDAENIPNWYADADGDGYGDSNSVQTVCNQPAGYVTDSADCNDSAAAVNPAATEVCDGIDNDCNAIIDTDSVSIPAWYRDSDGDGYGNASVSLQDCVQPSGYVSDSSDCNDVFNTAYPGATEVCDGIDNDCSGSIDDRAVDASTWYADSDGDSYGDAATTLSACSAPIGYVSDDADCDDGDAGINPDPSTIDVCLDDVDSNCDGSLTHCEASVSISGGRQYVGDLDDDNAGVSVAIAGDQNGDGHADILIGANAADGISGSDVGVAYLVTETNSSVIDLAISSRALIEGINTSDQAGFSLDGGVDVNGDGYPEIIAGAYSYDLPFSGAGASALFYGPISGALNIEQANVLIIGSASNDNSGYAVSLVQDMTSDGVGEIAIGSRNTDTGSSNSGSICLFNGSSTFSSTYSITDANACLYGESASDFAGKSIESGDVNGDGIGDLIIGVPFYGGSDFGAAYVVYGPISSGLQPLSIADLIFRENHNYYYAGQAVAFSDLDGDGLDDIAVGSRGYDNGLQDVGGVYLISGATSPGTYQLDTISSATAKGDIDGAQLGYSLAGDGDIDNDGLEDLAVGAPYTDNPGADTGSINFILGSTNLLQRGIFTLAPVGGVLSGQVNGDNCGVSVALSDLDGDGWADLLGGCTGNDTGGNNAGTAYLLYGATY